MQILAGLGLEAVPGFLTAGIAAGVKKLDSDKKDVAVIFSEVPATGAAVYTRNLYQAAPLLVTKAHLQDHIAQAVVVNSGNANACTGEQGFEDANTMASVAAEALGIKRADVVVASTGVIGVQLPIERVTKGIKQACSVLGKTGSMDVCHAMMTTDLVPKYCAVEIELAGQPVRVAGVAKGSGMIHPNMATMLGFIITDAAIVPELLQEALQESVANSFNMISVDGDTSTNDMCCVLANGLASNKLVKEKAEDYQSFLKALNYITTELAKSIARDGEGATKLVEVQVKQAPSLEDARKAAKAVVGSSLVKSAVFGKDANWGRIIAAIGYSGATFMPELVDIYLGSELMARAGCGLAFDEAAAKEVLEQDTVKIIVDLQQGQYEATAWGCDLTYDYVKINADYRT